MYENDIGGMYHEPSHWQYYLVGMFAVIIVMSVLVNTLQNLFQRVSPDLRSMPVVQLWITIIPVFGSIWIFYVIYQLANALSEEFKRRKIVEFETSPGVGVGWAFAFFSATGHLTLLIDEPVITILLFLAAIVLLIVYWVKVIGFKDKLDRDNVGHHLNPPSGLPFPPQTQQPFPPQQQWPPYQPPQAPPQSPSSYAPKSDDDWERWKPK